MEHCVAPLETNMNANVTPATNFFSDYISNIKLSLGKSDVDLFSDSRIIANILANLKESEYRKINKALFSYISDTGTAAANDIHIAASWTSGQASVAAAVQNQTVTNNRDFNHRYFSRKEINNYTVAKNNTARSVKYFILLNALFGNHKENKKVIKYIKFQIQ